MKKLHKPFRCRYATSGHCSWCKGNRTHKHYKQAGLSKTRRTPLRGPYAVNPFGKDDLRRWDYLGQPDSPHL